MLWAGASWMGLGRWECPGPVKVGLSTRWSVLGPGRWGVDYRILHDTLLGPGCHNQAPSCGRGGWCAPLNQPLP